MSDAETSYGFKICLCVESLIGLVELYMISWRRVSRSLTIRLETKMPWGQTPSRNKKSVMFTTVTTNTYQDQINAGFSKVCEIFKVCGIESLKYIREFTHWSIIVGRFPRPEIVTLNETNCDWLFDMLVKQSHGRALANESYHRFQTFRRQSEYLAMRD